MWDRHSKALFEAFMKANPEVMFRDESLGCAGEIQPHHRCHTRTHKPLRGRPLDHAQLCRLPDGRRFIISQPYNDTALSADNLKNIDRWKKQIPGLAWKDIGQKYSWYFPGNAYLIFIGEQDTLSALTLDYPVPTETNPTGCQRWKRNEEQK